MLIEYSNIDSVDKLQSIKKEYVNGKEQITIKILLISGHGAGDPGATGNGYKEKDLNNEMVNGVAPILRKYATVDIYPIEHNAYLDIKKNVWRMGWNYDYVFEIHFNAGGGTGTEMYVTTKEKRTTVEKAVLNQLSSLYRIRGIKVTNFLVIETAKNKGISSAMLETCFIDSANDIKVYQENKQKIFNAVALGIAQGFSLTTSSSTSTTPDTSTNTGNSVSNVAQDAKANGMAVATKDTVKKGFWISKYATIYGGTSYGTKIPSKILAATTKYTCIQIKVDRGEYWVLAKEINSWVKVSECMVKV